LGLRFGDEAQVTPKLRNLGPRMREHQTNRLPAPARATPNAPFYKSPEWRTLMAAIIAERGRRCEACGRTGCRIFGDHVIELSDGGSPLDRRNVKLLCGSCHTAKTAQARARRHGVSSGDVLDAATVRYASPEAAG
jgi:5-methylcytosine-specific restriction endonuclease McrA